MKKLFILMFLTLSLLCSALALAAENPDMLNAERSNRLAFGHVLVIRSVDSEPATAAPGESMTIAFTLDNSAAFELKNIRADLSLPAEFKFLDDVSKRKISTMTAGDSREVSFNLISALDAAEGIYDGTITLDYLNHIGDERQDNETFALIVLGSPDLFVKLEETEIYKASGVTKGNDVGKTTLTLVNEGSGDVKFLTAELQQSDNFDIVSSNREYVGDLDSDDFESVDFRIKRTNKDLAEIPLVLKVTYKDSLNNEYTETLETSLKVKTAKELGIKTNGTATVFFLIVIVGLIAYIVYRRIKKKAKHKLAR